MIHKVRELQLIITKRITRIRRWVKVAWQILKKAFFSGKKGSLSWYVIFRISLKNLIAARSRTVVTIGAIAIGTAAVVFLMSFSYGLERVVTSRLIHPNAQRLTDVQSQSTALSLNKKTMKDIRAIPNVTQVAEAISLAGSISYRNSRMDTVVIATTNDFLQFGNYQLLDGRFFSQNAQEVRVEQTNNTQISELIALVEKGSILGEEEEKPKIQEGQVITQTSVRFRLDDEVYVPVRSSPNRFSEILGYLRGSVLESYEAKEVWGGVYTSDSTVGKFMQDKQGAWWGKWMKTKVPLWEEVASTVYQQKKDTEGKQMIAEGYVSEAYIKILSIEETLFEKQLKKLMKEEDILGVSTDSAAIRVVGTATEEAELRSIIKSEKADETTKKTGSHLGFIEVKKQNGHELIVSTGFLNTFKIKPRQALSISMDLSYIVSGDLIPGLTGRVVSKQVTYSIVGIIKDDKKSYVFAPFSDVVSMGVEKYSIAKVLSSSENTLSQVRNRVETMGFVTQSIVDTLIQVNKLFRVMRFLLGAFGAIAFVVALFGMFNTLTVSLLERSREVGVMKTIGTTDDDIMRLFLVESLFVGVFGGVTGIVSGVLLGMGINTIFVAWQSDKSVRLFYAPFGFLLFILCLSVFVGLCTGIYPSYRARKVNPLDALRYE